MYSIWGLGGKSVCSSWSESKLGGETVAADSVVSSPVPAPIPTLAHAVALSEYTSALLSLMDLLLASADISAPWLHNPSICRHFTSS